MSPRLLGRGAGFGSLEGIHGSSRVDTPSGGTQGQEEAEVGANCEAAPYAEEEDFPPPYSEVAWNGADCQFMGGEETFV